MKDDNGFDISNLFFTSSQGVGNDIRRLIMGYKVLAQISQVVSLISTAEYATGVMGREHAHFGPLSRK